jgi:ubiquinone/menaquinone biosynthesis C-methylase UbiE
MLKLRKTTPSEPLIVSMTGLRTGDRVLFLGCEKPKHVALLAVRPGISGRACAVDDDAGKVAAAAYAAEREGALLEAEVAPLTSLPYETDAFDVVVLDHLLGRLDAVRRGGVLGEARRVLRPGGRCVVIERGGGLGALFGGRGLSVEEGQRALTTVDFRGVHILAEREGLSFVEGAKAGT